MNHATQMQLMRVAPATQTSYLDSMLADDVLLAESAETPNLDAIVTAMVEAGLVDTDSILVNFVEFQLLDWEVIERPIMLCACGRPQCRNRLRQVGIETEYVCVPGDTIRVRV